MEVAFGVWGYAACNCTEQCRVAHTTSHLVTALTMHPVKRCLAEVVTSSRVVAGLLLRNGGWPSSTGLHSHNNPLPRPCTLAQTPPISDPKPQHTIATGNVECGRALACAAY
uniref:Uncharacterized protein n=1 Tax=Parascaris univalens TaxID=6257 RepID=A0A915AC16_PARUN